jgi:hypothetical protein
MISETAKKKTPAKKTAKKKPTKKVPKKDSLKAQGLDKVFIDDDGQPALTEIQLLTFNAANAQTESAQAQWQLAEKSVQMFLQSQTAYTKLRRAADEKKNQFEKRNAAYLSKLDAISRELGLEMKQCIINDHNGKLTFLDDAGNITPDAPPYDSKKK